MKKILFATTALVASAGVASAEVALSGMAEMGIIGGETNGNAMVTQFHTDIDVTFTMSGEADNGLTFGATVDLDENGAFGNTTQGGETIFVSAGGATLTMGDTDGAFDAALQEMNLASGSINDDETAHVGFRGNGNLDGGYDGQVARFDYAFSGVTASLSAEIDDTDTFSPIWGIGVRYEGDFNGVALGVGLGYQSADADNDGTVPGFPVGLAQNGYGISVDAGFTNGVSVGAQYSVFDFSHVAGAEDHASHVGLGLGYEMNALAIGVNWGQWTDRNGVDGRDWSGFGMAASYDFGGGLSAHLGYGNSERDGTAANPDGSSWSLGLAMDF